MIPTSDGYAFGLRHQQLEWHGGYHTFSIQYGTGAASNFSNPGNGVTIQNPTPYINKSAQLLISEQVVVQPNDWFGIMPIFLYQRTKDGNPQDDWNQWASFGARPIVFFSKHLSLAFEAGFDHTESGIGQYEGGCANLPWRRKSEPAASFSAGRCCVPSSPMQTGRTAFAVW